MQVPEYEKFRLFMEAMSREAYAGRGYKDIRMVAVSDEDCCDSDPDVASLLDKGYRIIEVNAFGGFESGRTGSFVTMVLERDR